MESKIKPRICAGSIENLVETSQVICEGFVQINEDVQTNPPFETTYYFVRSSGGTEKLVSRIVPGSVSTNSFNRLNTILAEKGYFLANTSLLDMRHKGWNGCSMMGDLYREHKN
jgi:hypothetical protein